jgi:hypothetical protein
MAIFVSFWLGQVLMRIVPVDGRRPHETTRP